MTIATRSAIVRADPARLTSRRPTSRESPPLSLRGVPGPGPRWRSSPGSSRSLAHQQLIDLEEQSLPRGPAAAWSISISGPVLDPGPGLFDTLPEVATPPTSYRRSQPTMPPAGAPALHPSQSSFPPPAATAMMPQPLRPPAPAQGRPRGGTGDPRRRHLAARGTEAHAGGPRAPPDPGDAATYPDGDLSMQRPPMQPATMQPSQMPVPIPPCDAAPSRRSRRCRLPPALPGAPPGCGRPRKKSFLQPVDGDRGDSAGRRCRGDHRGDDRDRRRGVARQVQLSRIYSACGEGLRWPRRSGSVARSLQRHGAARRGTVVLAPGIRAGSLS